jgi:hypothetical protein
MTYYTGIDVSLRSVSVPAMSLHRAETAMHTFDVSATSLTLSCRPNCERAPQLRRAAKECL